MNKKVKDFSVLNSAYSASRETGESNALNRLAALEAAAKLEEQPKHALPALVVSNKAPQSLETTTNGASFEATVDGVNLIIPPGYTLYESGKHYGVGSRVYMPISITAEHPRNPRAIYIDDDEAAKSLHLSLATHGQLEAAQAYVADNGNGPFVFKSGHRRRRLLLSMGKTHIGVELVERSPSELEDFIQARALNVEHENTSIFDDGIRFKQLLDEKLVEDRKSLALMVGVSLAELSKCEALAELPVELLTKMKRNKDNFGLSSAYLIFLFWKQTNKNTTKAEELVDKVIKNQLSVRALERLIQDSSENTTPSKKKREHALSRVGVSGSATGELKAFEGRLSFELGSLDDSARNSIFSKIVAILKEEGLVTDEGVPLAVD